MISEGKVGETRLTSGSINENRLGVFGEQIVNDLGFGRYFESTRLGRKFILSAAAAGVAPAAANVSPLAAGTGQPLVGIFNPPGSNKLAIIMGAGFAATNVVTTQTTSMIVWNVILNPAGITAAGAAGAISARIDNVAASAVRTFVNAALTGSVAATMLRPLAANSQMSTNPAVAQAVSAYAWEETAGGIVAPPGAFVGLAAHAASATLYACSMEWIEVDWPL